MYDEILQYVKGYLMEHGGEEKDKTWLRFHKRSEHCKRVLVWTKRLLTQFPEGYEVETEVLFTAAIFHDIGYLEEENECHAERGEVIFRTYAKENGYEIPFTEKVAYLIKNHSNKGLLKKEGVPIEMILLMEADLLDDEGALSIAFDCMAAGVLGAESFEDALLQLNKYTLRILNKEPMVTELAKTFWKEKQRLVVDFMRLYQFDLGMEEE